MKIQKKDCFWGWIKKGWRNYGQYQKQPFKTMKLRKEGWQEKVSGLVTQKSCSHGLN